MNVDLIVKRSGRYFRLRAGAGGWRLEKCCGILEYGDAHYYLEPNDQWSPMTPEEKASAIPLESAHKLIVEQMSRDFGRWAMVVMTDTSRGENKKLMDLFDDPGWDKEIIAAQCPSHSTGRKLVTCVLTRKAGTKKKAKAE